MALTKVTKELIQGGLGVDWQATVKTGNFQAVASQGYFVNTTSNTVIVTMPPTASVGDIVSIVDYAGTAQTNNITITAQSNINGSANDVKIDYQRGAVSIIYSGTIQGWVAEFAANDGTDALVNVVSGFAANYLVVAGGGGGGFNYGAGGGAGGLLTNYNNGVAAITLSYAPTNYAVTVGDGGNASNSGANKGNNGTNSIFSNIISTGGGGGGSNGASDKNGLPGGSGGGGAGDNSAASTGIGGTANVSPTQGNNGGNGFSGSGGAAGGGGGAGGAGGTGSTGQAGAGGLGLANSITGTSTFYAGGGGANANGTNSNGGSSIGGNGGNPATNGVVNTGSGGGGSGTLSGSGGSGTVILRYPTADVSSYAVTGTLDTVANTAYPIANTAYYKLNGDALDSSGNANGQTTSVTYSAGRFGQAAVFNGISSEIVFPSVLSGITNVFSYSCWFKITDLTISFNTLDDGSNLNTNVINYIPRHSNGNYYITFGAESNRLIGTAPSSYSDGGWHHMVVTKSSSSLKFYSDGTLLHEDTSHTDSVSGLSNAQIAHYSSTFSKGSIDQVRIFNSALSAGNVTSLYNEGTVNESTDGTDSILQFIGGTGNITFS